MLVVSLSAASAQLSIADRASLGHRHARTELTPAQDPRIDMIVKVKDGQEADFAKLDAREIARRGNIVAVNLPVSQAESLAGTAWIERAELSHERHPLLDHAIAFGGVDRIHDGSLTSVPFSGQGVIVATVDRGLDPGHINFRADDGTSRIGFLNHSYSEPGYDFWTSQTFDRQRIAQFTTDARDEYHATHSLGIMTGSYAGPVKMAVAAGNEADIAWADHAPWTGVAPGADIAVSCGLTGDAQIIDGLEKIMAYCREQQKPAVISLPLGSCLGMHSPSTLVNQYLESLGREAVIVVAAGNYGDKRIALNKDFTASARELRSFIGTTYADNVRSGQVNFEASEPVALQAVIFDRKLGRIIQRMPMPEDLAEGKLLYYCSSNYVEDPTDITSRQFDEAFTGYLSLGWQADSATGQYTAVMKYYLVNNPATNAANDLVLGFIAEGADGGRLRCYCDGKYTDFTDYGLTDWQNGTADGAVSDLAFARNVLVVGSANSSTSYPALDYQTHQANFGPAGAMSSFSSWSSADGLPHILAPGAMIVSSSSTYYVEEPSNGVNNSHICGQADESRRGNYWAAASGTSAAAAYAAGCIALWLEADPTLTVDDVKQLAATTVSGSSAGFGIINPLCAIRNVLGLEGVASPTLQTEPVYTFADGILTIFRTRSSNYTVALYNLQGQTTARYHATSPRLTIDLGSAPRGPVVVAVDGCRPFKLMIH